MSDIVSIMSKALLLKQEVSAERFFVEGMPAEQAACPAQCHECCRLSVKMDLTGIEALLVYLLNREMIELVIRRRALTGDTGFCPFLVADVCVIHVYKPTACQMFMPYLYQGKPTCAYRLNGLPTTALAGLQVEQYLNSYSYDIHGYMLLCQQQLHEAFIPRSFPHIFPGVVYWAEQYLLLPVEIRNSLQALLRDNVSGENTVSDFDYGLALSQGHEHYLAMFEMVCSREQVT